MIDEKFTFCEPFKSSVLICEFSEPGEPRMLNVNVSLNVVLLVVLPVSTAPNSDDAGGVRLLGAGPVTTLAALATDAEAKAATPAKVYKSFRIPDLPRLLPKWSG
jgi:hypothetical protein